MNSKGFIGSIGDDFPSLIPLFFAVMLFFSTIGYAFTVINERNAYINTYIDSLKIAKTALGNGLFADYNNFQQIGNKINTTANYVVGLVYFDANNSDSSETMNDFLKGITTEQFISLGDDNCIYLNPEYDFSLGDEQKIYKICENNSQPNNSDNVETKPFVLSSPNLEKSLDDEGINIFDMSKTRKIYSYIYPVALTTTKGSLPVFLVVFVW